MRLVPGRAVEGDIPGHRDDDGPGDLQRRVAADRKLLEVVDRWLRGIGNAEHGVAGTGDTEITGGAGRDDGIARGAGGGAVADGGPTSRGRVPWSERGLANPRRRRPRPHRGPRP